LKILILKPSSLGDVVQALPVLRLLKRAFPQSAIYWWIDVRLAPLLEGDPDLTGLVLFDRARWAAPRHWGKLWRTIRWMREQNFDWVIDLQSLARSGAFAWLANGQLTVGLDDSREGARGFYDLIARRPSYHTHAVDWYLEVLKLLRVPVDSDFVWLPERRALSTAIQQRWPISNGRWIVLQPGARWQNKRWPVEYFAELVQVLGRQRPELRFAILGGSEDSELGEQIASANPERCLDLAGKLSLGEMVEWIRLSELMVTNDTGPMHVAAALRKHVVGLFGPTEPLRTGPYGQTQNALQLSLPCVPCMKARCTYIRHLECLRGLAPGRVADQVLHRLDNALG
jgi:lipopolysaccharide heptosyltransferase II